MAVMDTTCLYSTLKNISGAAISLPFLPPHGRKLAVDEEFTLFGDIREAVINRSRVASGRNIAGFVKAMADGKIAIQETPATIVFDAHVSVDAPQMLQISNSVITAVDPCWTNEV